MVEDRLPALHRIKAALDDGPIDPAFATVPAQELDDTFDLISKHTF